MQGSPKIIEFLNEALSAEVTAINQYFVHSKVCENWGWNRLAAKSRRESIDEMHDAEKLMDRILFLEGMPRLESLGSVHSGKTVDEQMALDRKLEEAAVARYRRGVALAEEQGDVGTRELLEHLLVGEEEHLDWIETQQSMIADIGIAMSERELVSALCGEALCLPLLFAALTGRSGHGLATCSRTSLKACGLFARPLRASANW